MWTDKKIVHGAKVVSFNDLPCDLDLGNENRTLAYWTPGKLVHGGGPLKCSGSVHEGCFARPYHSVSNRKWINEGANCFKNSNYSLSLIAGYDCGSIVA